MRWGLVATLKAPAVDVLNFAAHHLDLGADRLFLYLDERNDAAEDQLSAHPNVDVIRTQREYWTAGGRKRPGKHQVRQSRNADHAYARAGDLDWLAHVDVDEFLWPDTSVAEALATLPDTCLTARVRPAEALVPEPGAVSDTTLFKSWIPATGLRQKVSAELYPNYGDFVKGGFLSHMLGKIFVRTGQDGMDLRIHNAFVHGVENPGPAEVDGLTLLHVHVRSWEEWRAEFAYRHRKGSYRADLRPAYKTTRGGMNLHALFTHLLDSDGEAGLRHFFDEVCAASPRLTQGLTDRGLLREIRMDLDRKRQEHFPGFTPDC